MPHGAFSTSSPPSEALGWAALAELLAASGRRLSGAIADGGGLSASDQRRLALLRCCRDAPPEGASQREIADRLAVSAAHVSGLVEQLRAVGMIAAYRGSNDRRYQHWRLTIAGLAQMDSLLARLQPWARSTERRFGKENRNTLAASLAGMQDALVDDPVAPQRSLSSVAGRLQPGDAA